jgi:melanoma-associated antigen p97
MFYSPPPYADLIFQDAAQQLLVLPKEQRHFRSYLGRDFMRARALVDCHAGASGLTESLALIFMSTVAILLGRRHFQ